MHPTRFTRRILLALTAATALWGVTILLTGGFVVETPLGRVSSRNAERPLGIAVLLGVTYYLAFRRSWQTDAPRLSAIRWPEPHYRAALLAVLAFAFGVGLGSFVAAASDSYGYISQADKWVNGGLTAPAPAWVRSAPWPEAERTALPLGYVPGKQPMTQVPFYAPGLPLLMAPLQWIGGRSAVYVVVPVLGALTIWMTYLLGCALAGPWAGLAAALLMLASSGFLYMLVQPMSDVPVTAFWAVALYAAMRPGARAAAAAGAASAVAIVIRPNLVPLAAVVAAVVIAQPPRRLRDIVSFAAGVLPAALVVALINNAWYGSPLRSGYGTVSDIYSREHIVPNLQYYSGLLLDMQTPLILLGFAAPFVIRRARGRLVATLAYVTFPLAVLALYLPYLVFGEWPFIRFLLPAFPPLLAATAATLVTIAQRVQRPAVGIAATVLCVSGMALHSFDYTSAPFAVKPFEHRFASTGEYAQRLGGDPVFLSLLHSGSLRYYSGHDILRWDLLDPRYLDTAVDHLRMLNYPLYLVVDPFEDQRIQERFPGSRMVTALETITPVVVEGVSIYRLR